MTSADKLPIGVFDSGLGGLTVLQAIARRLPHEDLIYVGDTARVPYGTKSPETIRRYALQIAFFLVQKKVKAIVVACNTASAVALSALKNLPIPVIGVIEPGARAAVLNSRSLRIGVIGTPATMSSHAYLKAIKRYSKKARVMEAACPLFVPLVEEGWTKNPVTLQVARRYLAPLRKIKMDTLVLGCTHYPLLKDTLQKVVGPRVGLVDSAEQTAKEVEKVLSKNGALNPSSRAGKAQYFVTDHPAAFSRLGRLFMGKHTSPAKRLRLESV